MFKLALVQMRVEGGQPQDNLARALGFVAQAAAAGADVVLLPETFTLGWTHPGATTLAEAIPEGPSCRALMSAAAKHGVYICAGLVERAGEKIFNAAVLIDAHGEVVLLHRKINELEIAHGLYAQGDRLGVAQTPFGTFGVMVCADAFAPGQVVARALGLMGADVILSPSSWAVPANHDNAQNPYGALWLGHYGAVAQDFRVWVAGVSNVGWLRAGPWSGQQCIGSSLVVAPNGQAVLRGPYGVDAEALLCVDIEPVPRPARGTAWEQVLG